MSSDSSEKSTKLSGVLSISHDKDVDGMNSAAIVWRYAKSKGLEFSVMLTDYGSFEPVFSKVAKRRDTLVIITDLSVDDSLLDLISDSLSRATSQGCRIVWLDHHHWNDRAVGEIQSLPNSPVLKVNHEYCASEIAHKVLMPRDEISGELARIAHDTDFNLREIDAAVSLTDALTAVRFAAMNKKEDVTAAIMPLLAALANDGIEGLWNDENKRFKDSLLDGRVREYRKARLKKLKKALACHCDQVVNNRLVRIVEMPVGVTTTDLGTFLSDAANLEIEGQALPVADLLITVSQGGMLGFRRGNESTLCNAAASLFNGGGHPYAAGGEYGMYNDFQAVCDDIFLTLSRNVDWVVSQRSSMAHLDSI
ncbi:MAG: DHH family phosphoesterase [Candidatus Thorarchaeota archaeon]|jgi:oligoribonuclease NrnB/cAMP/cGMP phosphodiesterase (DHH superfamily)